MSTEQKQLTGFPSKDKPWLKFYDEDAEAKANDIPMDKTVWDVLEEKLLEYSDIPALEYFGREFTRPEFIDLCYTWAKAFKATGVKENEVVSIYGPFMPDICAMTFGLNMIGACPYFLKLAISPEALAEETKDSKVAVVFDQMWENVSPEFAKDRFQTVIIARITDAMPNVKKQIVSAISGVKSKVSIPKGKKYISVSEAKKLAGKYTGEVKVPFVPDRAAFITSSSGTTVGGVVKGVVATNESVLAQVYSNNKTYAEKEYIPGVRVLNHFPPTAATSLNSLFLVPLINGVTVIIDPRVSEDDFYNQLIALKPNVCVNTGSLWETFFNRISDEMKKGKCFDFSYARFWMVGGEGTSPKNLKKWNDIMKKCGAGSIFCGYGLSETFSGLCFEGVGVQGDSSKPVVSAGPLQAGMVAGIFDRGGKELKYNQRGELMVSTKAAMKEYYNKPQLTAKTKVDGWIRTGDLAEIDENGFVYIWGRISDKISTPNGQEVYLFDVANRIKEKEYIDDAIVLEMPTDFTGINLVAHIVWNECVKDSEKCAYLSELNQMLQCYGPEISLYTYAEHKVMLPYSPTTLKKDKNRLAKQMDGYVQVVDGTLRNVRFVEAEDGLYEIKYL